jgi:hypothetical protein
MTNFFLLYWLQVDGVSITGDLPLLSLGKKIVVQPRQLLHIAARGGSELEFTSIASTLTGLKVSSLGSFSCHIRTLASHGTQVSSLNVSVGGVATIACEYVIPHRILQPQLGHKSHSQIRSASDGILSSLVQACSRTIPLIISLACTAFEFNAMLVQVLVNPNSGRKNAAIVWRRHAAALQL